MAPLQRFPWAFQSADFVPNGIATRLLLGFHFQASAAMTDASELISLCVAPHLRPRHHYLWWLRAAAEPRVSMPLLQTKRTNAFTAPAAVPSQPAGPDARLPVKAGELAPCRCAKSSKLPRSARCALSLRRSASSSRNLRAARGARASAARSPSLRGSVAWPPGGGRAGTAVARGWSGAGRRRASLPPAAGAPAPPRGRAGAPARGTRRVRLVRGEGRGVST